MARYIRVGNRAICTAATAFHRIRPNPGTRFALRRPMLTNQPHPIIAKQNFTCALRIRFMLAISLFQREIGYDVDVLFIAVQGRKQHERVKMPVFQRRPR